MKKVIYIDLSKMTYKEACYALGPKGVSLYKTHVWSNVGIIAAACVFLVFLVFFRY